MINNTLTYISLFSSAGIGCFGFQQAGFECIATNEVLPRRLQVQRYNQKCKYDSGYILGDIQKDEIKQAIYHEIEKWHRLGNDKVDVVIATPPCQGMSVANHKKNGEDLSRNSLIVQSVEIIKNINPRFFIFENVSAFWKTGCVNTNNEIISIGDMILSELGGQYSIFHKIINFKNYGSFSSRTRTIVIGVERKLTQYISPLELFPDYQDEVLLKEIIGNMKSLDWGEYDRDDFFHSFRVYPEHMRAWIKDIKQGQSAFEQTDPLKIPHQIKDGKMVVNASKNGDKYTRQKYDSVAPCIHTRNDQLASQNTIHPIDDRVFSIRELMKMMSIPNEFKWLNQELNELNNLSWEDKKKLSKKEEMNIRQSIGEAVPTVIFRKIAENIKSFIKKQKLPEKEIYKIIDRYNLQHADNLIDYIKKNRENIDFSSLSSIIELSNAKRQNNSAFFTNKFIIDEIVKNLPKFKKDEIIIIEPSVGGGNFLPLLFKFYDDVKKVNLIVVDVDKDMIGVLKILYDKRNIPKNFNIEFVCQNFMHYKNDQPIDLIIGNPPFTKLSNLDINQYLHNNFNKSATNLAEFFLEKAVLMADYVSFVMPKNLLNTPEYYLTRKLLSNYAITYILDIGEKGFKGVLVETVNILVAKNEKIRNTKIHSLTEDVTITNPQHYIFDNNLPYWVIYRDDFFDKVYQKLDFNVFDVFRDRQITNGNSSLVKKSDNDIRVVKSRNIDDTGTKLLSIENYDAFLSPESLKIMSVSKFLQRDDVYMTPNMTYKPRLMKKSKGYVVNGSVALLIPKSDFVLTDEQMRYISSDEFREFYRIARNYQTRSLNIDSTSVYWFGIYQG